MCVYGVQICESSLQQEKHTSLLYDMSSLNLDLASQSINHCSSVICEWKCVFGNLVAKEMVLNNIHNGTSALYEPSYDF